MYKELNPILLSQLRLAIMSYLMVVQEADFNTLKAKTDASSGNLSIQIAKLQESGYVEVIKTYKNNYPLTVCKITADGTEAFEAFYRALKEYFGGPDTGK